MVKPDVRQDYYALLDVHPSADTKEIKKQYRKLALKYHPDKNPGQEVEFNAKFHAIKTANEILGDPEKRLAYDSIRLRAGYGKDYVPAKANTQRKPPPSQPARSTTTPKPRAPPQYPRTPPNGPSSGARRYANHARAGPEWKAADEEQTRADAFRAFHNMRGNHQPGWQGFDPSTGRPSGGTPGPGAQRNPFGTSAQSSRPKSAFETFRQAHANAQAQSPKKKQGFAPASPGGDEPMARNTSAYSSTTRADRPNSQFFGPAPPPTAKKPSEPEPPHPPFIPEFDRHSRGYAQAGKGEKTFLSSNGLGRSHTTRVPSVSTGPNANANTPSPAQAQPGRHRSASPNARRQPSNYDSTSSSESDSMPKRTAVPKSRLRPGQNFADFHEHSTQSSKNGEDPLFSGRIDFGIPDIPEYIPRWPGFELPDAHGLHPRPQKILRFKHRYADRIPKGQASHSAPLPKHSFRPSQHPDFSGSSSSINAETGIPPERPQTTAFEHTNTSDLHKKFSAEDWRGKLDQLNFLNTRTSPDKGTPVKPPASWTRGRTAQRSANGSPVSNQQGTTPLQPFPGAPPPLQNPTHFAQATFSADSWSEQLQNLPWTPSKTEKAPQPTNSVPPRSPKQQTREGTKLRSIPQSASVTAEADEAHHTLNGQTPSVPASTAVPNTDVEEMDLDDLPTPPKVSPMNTKVPLGRSSSGSHPNLASKAGPDSPVKKSRPLSQTEAHKYKSSSRPALFDMGNLRNAGPFTEKTSGGIDNLGDFNTALPFDSRAKQQTTTKRDIQPRDLQLPNPPKRPPAPEAILTPGSSRAVLPRNKWDWYVTAMGAYMHEWNAFNRRMLTHFNARQEANETGLAPGWISAVGDSTRLKIDDDNIRSNGRTKAQENGDDHDEFLVPGLSKGGFSAYLRGVEEDIQVRKHWEVASELHRDCILELGRLREWIRNGGKVA